MPLDQQRNSCPLSARGTRSVPLGCVTKTPVATTAIAREVAAFLWAIGQQVAPRSRPSEGLCNSELIMTNKLSLGARFRRQSLAPRGANPGGRWGLTAQRGQAEVCGHMMNADVLASSTSPYGEAHISGYRVTLSEDRRPTYRQT
jgi:hypothetical protein